MIGKALSSVSIERRKIDGISVPNALTFPSLESLISHSYIPYNVRVADICQRPAKAKEVADMNLVLSTHQAVVQMRTNANQLSLEVGPTPDWAESGKKGLFWPLAEQLITLKRRGCERSG